MLTWSQILCFGSLSSTVSIALNTAKRQSPFSYCFMFIVVKFTNRYISFLTLKKLLHSYASYR